jgi:hypothetical protein
VIIREELLEYSLLQRIREGLPAFGFTLAGEGRDLDIREAFPTPEERSKELTITTLAFGFNIDDGGKPAELGSTLTEYTHTIMCWTFGLEPRFARRVAHSIKHILRGGDGTLPLLDFNQVGDPAIDNLEVLKAQVQHQMNASPRPWDQYVWTTSINVRDVYFP